MNLIGSALYDPAVAVSKATSGLLALTAFDTANLRLAITVPAHGKVRFKMRCAITGATTVPTILLGVLNGATVLGRVSPMYEPATANIATQTFTCDAEFTVTGLTPGAMNVDAAYAVQVVVASTNIKYGGPNTNAGANAWGGFLFEAWDPQPVPTAAAGASGGLLISGSNAGTTTLGAFTVTGATTFTGATVYTGNVSYADGITIAAPSTLNRPGFSITGNGTGAGITTTGGASAGHGIAATGGTGAGDGIIATGGSTGHGIQGQGGATSGSGIVGNAQTSGHGFNVIGAGTGDGIHATGGATGDGASFTGGATSGDGANFTVTSGVQLRANITGDITGNVSGSVGSIAAGGLTSLWGYTIEGTVTAEQMMRGYASALLSKASGLAGTAAVYRDISDTKARITATVDASGNRTAVTLDLTP